MHHQQSSEESNDRVTMKVMITLIVIAAPVDMVAEIISMEKIIMVYEPKYQKRYSHSSTHDCLRFSAPHSSISASDGVMSSQ